jgi:hypothetical protein
MSLLGLMNLTHFQANLIWWDSPFKLDKEASSSPPPPALDLWWSALCVQFLWMSLLLFPSLVQRKVSGSKFPSVWYVTNSKSWVVADGLSGGQHVPASLLESVFCAVDFLAWKFLENVPKVLCWVALFILGYLLKKIRKNQIRNSVTVSKCGGGGGRGWTNDQGTNILERTLIALRFRSGQKWQIFWTGTQSIKKKNNILGGGLKHLSNGTTNLQHQWIKFSEERYCARRDDDVHQRMNANSLLPYNLFSWNRTEKIMRYMSVTS